jgi:hypothetical protein
MTDGTLQIQITTLQPLAFTQDPAVVTPTATRSGTLLQNVQFAAGIFAVDQFVVPVTDPDSFPIVGVQATASNGAANFTRAANFGGQMPMVGANKVCLYGSYCGSAANANITVPVSVVGKGGTVAVSQTANGGKAPVFVTVRGAPWTTGTAAVGTITRDGGTTHMTGMTTMGASQYTDTVTLVTPVFISTNIPAVAVVPAFGTLSFKIVELVPEPGTMAAFGAVIAALVWVGHTRRK